MHVNGWTEPVLMGKSNPKVAYACGRMALQESRKERRAEGARASPGVTSVFSGAQQSVFSSVVSRVVVFENNFIPKPPFLLLFILTCVTKAYLWGDENTLKLDCGDG